MEEISTLDIINAINLDINNTVGLEKRRIFVISDLLYNEIIGIHNLEILPISKAIKKFKIKRFDNNKILVLLKPFD